METKYTPGPWRDGGSSLYGGRRIVVGCGDDERAIAMTTADATGADALLIIAAPELLAALAETLARIDDAGRHLEAGIYEHPEVQEFLRYAADPARAAIAKAEGE
jgi:hypothetical protein